MRGGLEKEALVRLLGGKDISVVEKWRRHSLAAGIIAKRIALAVERAGGRADASLTVAGAVLHDIGRELSCGLLHGWYGYLMLRADERFRRCARFCVTHWLKGRKEEEIRRSSTLSEKLIKTIKEAEDFQRLSLEDMVVCVADAMAQGELLVDIERRYADARIRYGNSVWISENLRRTLEFKYSIDGLIGYDLYGLFSGFGETVITEHSFNSAEVDFEE